MSTSTPPTIDEKDITKAKERKAFLFILIFLFPIVTSLLIGGYGFAIWFSQIIFGPPGHG